MKIKFIQKEHFILKSSQSIPYMNIKEVYRYNTRLEIEMLKLKIIFSEEECVYFYIKFEFNNCKYWYLKIIDNLIKLWKFIKLEEEKEEI